MIIANYSPEELHAAFGIEMSSLEGFPAGAGWGLVRSGGASTAHQHDETEVFVVLRGTGEIEVNGLRQAVAPGSVCQFEPFETHVIANTGAEDLVFFDLYWRDPAHAARQAHEAGTARLRGRPVFVFSTPPTPNGDLHLGHLSGPYLGADVFVRAQRLRGVEAWHLTGSDDYQSYVVECARREGRSPAETAAAYSAEIAETLRLLDIQLDQYTVTNQDLGYPAALRDYFARIVQSGRVALRDTPATFDPVSGDYLYEVDVSGGCPACGAGTNGNICEECGEANVCADLAEPRSRLSNSPARVAEAARYVLPLHEFAAEVAEHHRIGRVPTRLRELADRLFRRDSLDIPITHPSEWGVSFGGGDALGTQVAQGTQETQATQDTEGQVIWVWPEMAYGFLHGVQALGERLGRDWRSDAPEPEWKIVHFFGYDNSFYHAVLYPALYRLAFPDWTPDIDYHVNEFYLLDGEKFSTSRRHAVWGKEVLNPQTVDAVRFYLSLTRPETARTNFEFAAFQSGVEEELIGRWQGWLSSLGARIADGFEGVAPDAGNWTPEHTAFLNRLTLRLDALTASLGPDGFSLNRAAEELQGLVADVRRFSAAESATASNPTWHDETRTAVALELAAARLLSRCAAPVMPRFAAQLVQALGGEGEADWPAAVDLVSPGTKVDLVGRSFFAPIPDRR